MSEHMGVECSEAKEHNGIVWDHCTRRPLLALVGFFLLVICVWTPFYFAAPILPIVLETDFEKYLTSNEPAFKEYEEVSELEKQYSYNAFDLDNKFHDYRQLQETPSILPFSESVEIIYLCVTESCDTIFTESNLEKIKTFERKFEANFYSQNCQVTSEGACKEAVSILNFFYPSVVNGNLRRFDGNGDELVSIQSALEALKVAGELWFASRKFLSDDGKSLVARSQFSFNTPDEAAFRSLCKDRMLGFLNDEQDQGDFRILWYSKRLNEVEIETVIISDSMLAIASLLIVFFIMWGQSCSLFLTCVSVLCTLLCYPATYVVYRYFVGIEVMMIFNFTSIFVLIGIGADNFFIFSDLWTQSKGLEGFTTAQRLSWTFQQAAGATLITTMTTAASFLANLASPIEPVRSFGLFMGIVVIFLYLHMVVALPLALAAHEKYFSRICSSCTSSPLGLIYGRKNHQSDNPVSPSSKEYKKSEINEKVSSDPTSMPGVTAGKLDNSRGRENGTLTSTDDQDIAISFTDENRLQLYESGGEYEEINVPTRIIKKNPSAEIFQYFGTSTNIRLEMESEKKNLDDSYPLIVRIFHGKIGPFVYRFRYLLVMIGFSLVIGLGFTTIKQIQMSDTLPDIFSPSTNLGMLFNIRKEYFSDQLSAPDYTSDFESNVCYDSEGKVVFCTNSPTFAPTQQVPTYEPTYQPTLNPSTASPTVITTITTPSPTKMPTKSILTFPPKTSEPSMAPTTATPTTTETPTAKPTTETPTSQPTNLAPTNQPTTLTPSIAPTTISPTAAPITQIPTSAPSTQTPTLEPTSSPLQLINTTETPTGAPPTPKPTRSPTNKPTKLPTSQPTTKPTTKPTEVPTSKPTTNPTNLPTAKPTDRPTVEPTTESPTHAPTFISPTVNPTRSPTTTPSAAPTSSPISPYMSSISLLDRNTGQALSLEPSFDSYVFFYNIHSGTTHPTDIRITADPVAPRVQVLVKSVSESEYEVFINPEVKYHLNFTFEKPLQCDCHGNGVCADEATEENKACKCYNGWTIESNCSQVDPTLDRLGDSNVLEVQISWLRSRGTESFVGLQTEMLEMCNKIDALAKSFEEDELQVRRVNRCIIREMWNLLDGTKFLGRAVQFPLNVTEEEFARALQYYITRYNPSHRSLVLFNDDLQIVSLSLTVLTNIDNLAGAVEADVYYKRWEEYVQSQDTNAIQTSFLWARTQTEIAVVSGTKTSALISILCAFIAILVFSRFNWILTIVTTFSIASVIILLLSTMVVIQHRPIGAIESLSCIILLGMAVDYSTHLAHTFNHSKCNTLEARTRHTLGQTGISILFGALTTSGAAVPLLFTHITLFQDFGMFVIINMGYSLLLAVFFLTPCLVLAYNAWNKIRNSKCFHSFSSQRDTQQQ